VMKPVTCMFKSNILVMKPITCMFKSNILVMKSNIHVFSRENHIKSPKLILFTI
jgi:hypothetical protein